jgi:hypothetical protein
MGQEQNTTTGRRGSTTVHRHWLANPELSDSGLRLMLWLDSHTHQYLADLSVARVAKELTWGRNRVKRVITHLEQLGLLRAVQQDRPGGGTRTVITLHLSAWSEPVVHSDTATANDGPSQTSAMVHGEARAVVHGEAPTYSNSIENMNSSKTQLTLVSAPSAFDQFWAVYPRKVGKPDAAISFKAALKRATAVTITDGLERWANHWTAEGTQTYFIPHPATWLNQDRFNDLPVRAVPKLSRNMQTLTNPTLTAQLAAIDARNNTGEISQ